MQSPIEPSPNPEEKGPTGEAGCYRGIAWRLAPPSPGYPGWHLIAQPRDGPVCSTFSPTRERCWEFLEQLAGVFGDKPAVGISPN